MCLALFVQTLDPSVFATENLNQKNFRVKVKMDIVWMHMEYMESIQPSY